MDRGRDVRVLLARKDASPPVMELLKASTKGLGRTATSVEGNVMTTYFPLHAGDGAGPSARWRCSSRTRPSRRRPPSRGSSVRTGAVALGLLMLLAMLLGSSAGCRGGAPPRRAPGSSLRVKARNPAGRREGEQAGCDRNWHGPTPTGARRRRSRTAQEELAKVREQARSGNDRAGERIEELYGELERVNAKLKDAQVIASGAAARMKADPAVAERVLELEEALRRSDTEAPPPRSAPPRYRRSLSRTRAACAAPTPRSSRSAPESADLRASVERLSTELGDALERAREAEDLAAAFQDRVTAADAELAATAEPDPSPYEARPSTRQRIRSTYGRRASPRPSPAGDDEEADGRPARRDSPARRRARSGHNIGDPEWP